MTHHSIDFFRNSTKNRNYVDRLNVSELFHFW